MPGANGPVGQVAEDVGVGGVRRGMVAGQAEDLGQGHVRFPCPHEGAERGQREAVGLQPQDGSEPVEMVAVVVAGAPHEVGVGGAGPGSAGPAPDGWWCRADRASSSTVSATPAIGVAVAPSRSIEATVDRNIYSMLHI